MRSEGDLLPCLSRWSGEVLSWGEVPDRDEVRHLGTVVSGYSKPTRLRLVNELPERHSYLSRMPEPPSATSRRGPVMNIVSTRER